MNAAWETIHARSLDCVHCGLCLPVCPTYRETGRETSSPRGRIYLMRATAEGRVDPGPTLAEEAYLCLGCRACETACPSGVEFGSMLELARAEVEKAGLRRGIARFIERFSLRHVVAQPARLRAALGALGGFQRLRLDRWLRPLLPRGLRELVDAAPRVPPASARAAIAERTPARGERRGTVALFVGCVMPELFGEVHAATIRVLSLNGFDVLAPSAQACCGALHAHAGDLEFATGLARKNVTAFADEEIDAVVVNSAGCGAALRELPHWLPDEAEALSSRIRDVTEFLDEVGLRAPPGPLTARVCYDDPCHLVHAQGVAEAPRRVLSRIPGLELVEHEDASACCGAAGIYNLTHREMSQAVLDRKLAALAVADPDIIATGNPGCLIQLRGGVQAAGLRAEVLHPIELLDRAYDRGL